MGDFLERILLLMAAEGSVFVIGNPLLDISATVNEEYLKKYNLLPSNAILASDEHLPMYPEMISQFEVEYSAGGAGQNTARAISWMLQQHNVAVYVGCIGADQYGERLQAEARADGVDVHYLVDDITQTGTCASLIVNHERSLVANLGAANKYQKSHFDNDLIQEKLNKAKFLYSAGFFLTVSPETLEAIGKHALENDKLYMFNLSAPFLIDFFTEPLKTVLPYTDIVIGNEHEGLAFGKKFFDTDDLKEVALKLGQMEKLNKKRERIVIITQGSEPIIVYKDGAVSTYDVESVPESEIVDSNGAGDSFAGAFIAGLILGKDFETCIKAGEYCGAHILKTGGVEYKGTPSFKF